MSSGSISAMISSLKSNKRLRRNKESYSKFYRKPTFKSSSNTAMSNAEKKRMNEDRKKERAHELKGQLRFRRGMLLFYTLLLVYVLSVIL